VILLVSATRGPGSGAERVLEHLLDAWPDPARTFALLAPRGSRLFEQAQARGIAAAPLVGADTLVGTWGALGRVAPHLPPCRLVHAWSARAFELAALIAGARGVPHAATLHDHPASAYLNGVRRTLMRIGAARASGVVCVSEAVRAACSGTGHRWPLSVIRNGLPDLLPSSERRPPRPAPGPAPVRVGFLGMNAVDKGFAIVEGWVHQLRRTRPGEVRWHLYGQVDRALRARADSLRAGGVDVSVEGPRRTEEITDEVDVIVHPSVAFDAFPTVLLEAARAGVPAVASDVGGTAEIVEDGVTGFVFDLHRADDGVRHLARLIAEAPLRRALAGAARARFARSFGIGAMVDGYRGFWAHAVGASGGTLFASL
jgi:glycosyltransferase involved in cell wall biosynthesis